MGVLVSRIVAFVVTLLLTSGIAPGERTDSYCPNISAVSASGRYRFDSTHLNNEHATICFGFTIKLTDTSTGTVVWERVQKPKDPAAWEAWVGESGRVVIDNGMRHLLSASTGKEEYTWGYDSGLVDADRAFIKERWTTAGTMSNQHLLSRRYLLEHNGQLYFVVRYFWGRHTFVDLDQRETVRSPMDALARAAEEADREFVRVSLDAATVTTLLETDWYKNASRTRIATAQATQIAVFLAGQLKVREVIPQLRALEECGYVSASGGVGIGRCWQGGLQGRLHSVRRAAHVALRRMGERAGTQPCYTITVSGNGWRTPELGKVMERSRLASWVAVGMQAEKIFEAAGSPDWGDELSDQRDGDAFKVLWEYDVDGDAPSTLQISISSKGEVTRVVKATPSWADGFQRDVGDW